ncbi:MAG: porin [Halobacteriovoraceae bacterium]|nr:porin [Halobacteriovoraceae bacterium]
MKKMLMSMFVFTLCSSMAIAAAPKMSWNGHVRGSLESGTGSSVDGTGSGPKFGVLTSRVTANTTMNRAMGSLEVELADGVRDNFRFIHGYAGYKFGKTTMVQVGRFKVPIGIDHLTAEAELDLAERNGLTTSITHGWKNGLMLSGDVMGGLSYNLAYFTSSNNVEDYHNRAGRDNAYAARLMYDRGNFHLEAAYAAQEGQTVAFDGAGGTTAGGANIPIGYRSNVFHTMGFGFSYQMNRLMLKGEYLSASNVGVPSGDSEVRLADMTTMYAHVGFNLRKNLDLMVRYYKSDVEGTAETHSIGTAQKPSLNNIYLGFNVMPEKNVRFQFNYVLVSGDDRDAANPFPAIEGVRTANTLLAQAMITF